jgi:hypothetical protein
MIQEGETPPFHSLAALDSWVASGLNDILRISSENLVLLLGRYYVALFILQGAFSMLITAI